MRKTNFILIFLMVILGFIITPNFAKATDDLTFEFQKEILYNSSVFEYNNSFNLAPTSYYSGHYNATYSFENEVGLTGTDISFVDISTGLTTMTVINSLEEHEEVLDFFDNDNGNSIDIKNVFNPVIEGIIEFWVFGVDVSKGFQVQLFNDGGLIRGVRFRVDSDKIQYFHTASWNDATGGGVSDNIWYHIKLDFNCNTDTYNFSLNGIILDSNIPFENVISESVMIRMITDTSDSVFHYYIDAIGYSWDSINPFFFDYTSETAFASDITFDGTFLWLIDYDSQVFKYDINGVYQSITYDWSAQDSDSSGITFDGTFFWMASSDGILYKYNVAGIYQAETWSPENLDFPTIDGIDFDGTFWWLMGADRLYKYDIGKNQIFKKNLVLITDTNYGVCSDGINVWVLGSFDGLFKFDFDGNYLDINIPETSVSSTEFSGCVFDGRFFWWIGLTTTLIVSKVDIIPPYYYIGKNLMPSLVIDTSLLQISAYELCFSEADNIHNIGDNNPENWEFDETGGGILQVDYDWTSAVVYPSTTFFRDRTVSFNAFNTDYCTMNRSSIDIEDIKFTNITFGLNITSMFPDAPNRFHIELYESDDNSILTHLRFTRNLGVGITLSYWYEGLVLITDEMAFNKFYDFNVLLNFELNLIIITIIEDNIYFDTFYIPFADTSTGDNSFGNISLKAHSDVNDLTTVYIDYIGILNNGTTQIDIGDTYGYTEIKLNNEWNFTQHNLLFFKGLGNLSIYDFQPVNNLDYVPAHATSHTLDDFRQHNNTIITNNIYDLTQIVTDYNQLIIYTAQNISFNYISIEGVALNQSTNQYWLEFEYSNVDINESYFYVDSSNKLQFNHISDDSDLEYIQATFDVNDVSSDNYSVAFKSYIQNNAYGYFRVNYTDTSNIIQLKNSATITRFLLEQNRIIRNIVILITDKDNNVITGLTTGYVYDIKLLDIINIQVSLITQTLINMMIPLIIILIPTLGFSSKFGKNVIIPFFILFSLILTATGTIPYWLFFIIAFSSLVIILFKSKDLGE